MASTFTISAGTSRYGWKDSSVHDADGKTGLYLGNVYNGTAYRNYDSAIRFVPPSSPEWGTEPIIVNSVELKTTRRGGTPYTNGVPIYLSTGGTPTSFTKLPDKQIGTLTSSSCSITDADALAQIAIYLQQKTTFYIHVYGSETGGSIEGYGETARPKLTIEWEYAETSGTLSKTFYSVGETATLTADVRGTGYSHVVSLYINNTQISTENITSWNIPSTRTKTFNLSPSVSQIDTWFPLTSSTSSCYVEIITKKSDVQIGSPRRLNFTLNLTASYCESVNYFKTTGISFSNTSDNGTNMGLIAGRSKVVAQGTWSRDSLASVSFTATLETTGGLTPTSDTKTASSGSSVASGTLVIGSYGLSSLLTIVDGRGLVYTYSKSTATPKQYSEIVFSNVDFYRSDGMVAAPLGTKVGCKFNVAASLSGNTIEEIYVKVKDSTDKTTTVVPNTSTYTYESTNLFPDLTFNGDNSHTFEIWVKDKITGNSQLYGYTNGYKVYTVVVSSTKYIIHIPQLGNGIAFGTASSGDGTVELGWPLKGKVFETDKTVNIFGTNVSNLAGLRSLIVGSDSYVPINNTFEGNIKLAEGSAIVNNDDNNLLTTILRETWGEVQVGNTTQPLQILSTGQLTHSDGTGSYPILRYGKEVIVSATEPTSPAEGTIWLRIP